MQCFLEFMFFYIKTKIKNLLANRKILRFELANVILERSEESFASSLLEDDKRLAILPQGKQKGAVKKREFLYSPFSVNP